MNNQTNQAETVQISLNDYVNQLDNSQKTDRQNFREELAAVLCLSPVTMRQKLDNNRWKQREKEALAAYLNSTVEILFPES